MGELKLFKLVDSLLTVSKGTNTYIGKKRSKEL